MLVERRFRLGRVAAGQGRAQHARKRVGDGLLVGPRRGDDHVQAVDGPGQGHVQQAQRFLYHPLFVGGEHPLEFGGQDRAEVFRYVTADPLDAGGWLRTAGHNFRRLTAHAHVQFRQHDDVELQALALVNGHHADAGRGGVFHALLLDQVDKIRRPQRGPVLVAVGHFHELREPAHVAAVAGRGQGLGPAFQHRPVALDHQPPAGLFGQLPGGGRIVVIGKAQVFPQRRMGYVETRGRIAGVVGQGQEREQDLHGGRIGQRVAALLAGFDSPQAQFKDQPGHGDIAADEHADFALRRLLVQPLDFLGRIPQRGRRLVLALRGRRCRSQAAVAG